MNAPRVEDPGHRLVRRSAEVLGSAAGAALGLYVGGPIGAVWGAATGPALAEAFREIGAEVGSRLLGRREELRVGTALGFAIARTQARLEAGDTPRSDGFFRETGTGRSQADEVLEAGLMAAQRTAQERKLRFLGNLMANIAFDPSVSPDAAAYLIQQAETLTYRQLLLLWVFGNRSGGNFNLHSDHYDLSKPIGAELVSLLGEIHDLYLRGMVNASGLALQGAGDIIPNNIQVQGLGGRLYTLMGLGGAEGLTALEVMPVIAELT